MNLKEQFKKFPNFKPSEFVCPCCGVNTISFNLMQMLQKARTQSNTPFGINSACRCIFYTKKRGWSLTSSHLIQKLNLEYKECLAVDIRNNNEFILNMFESFDIPNNSIERFNFLKKLIETFGNSTRFTNDKNLRLLKSLLDVGFIRIGISKTFIHVDIDMSKDKNVCWIYK